MYSVFCKQKAAYEVGMSDWSSDVCSSDLHPLDASAGSVALSLPGSDLAFELRAIVDAKVQALASQDTDLDLGHVEPAGVLRREVELQPAEAAVARQSGVSGKSVSVRVALGGSRCVNKNTAYKTTKQ